MMMIQSSTVPKVPRGPKALQLRDLRSLFSIFAGSDFGFTSALRLDLGMLGLKLCNAQQAPGV